MPKINIVGQMIQTGECPKQTDTHTRTLLNVLSPRYAVDNCSSILYRFRVIIAYFPKFKDVT